MSFMPFPLGETVMPASGAKDINERLEELKQKDRRTRELILKDRSAVRALRILTCAGADKDKILRLLSLCVHDEKLWQEIVRRKKKELESVANQLETVANHAQRLSLDPLSYDSLWSFVLQIGKLEDVKLPEECSPTFIFESMRSYAKNCKDRAKVFGTLLRQYPAREKRQMTEQLMFEIWLRTGKHFDKEVACLLTIAFETVGRDRQFTMDQVKKQRQRHIVSRIRSYQKS
jgi:hypothetical protein